MTLAPEYDRADLVDVIPIIDADTHIMEPYDLWTSRMSVNRWGDLVPHVRWDEDRQEDSWFVGSTRIHGGAQSAMAGWHEHPPLHPRRLSEADPTTWDLDRRIGWMDKYGIESQVLYPNVQGFGTGRFLAIKEPTVMLECVQAYNDFLSDVSDSYPGRFIPIMALPFWDVELSLKEMERAAGRGHAGIIFGQAPEFWGQPHLTYPHWDPLWSAAEEMNLPVNFHIAAGDLSALEAPYDGMGAHTKFSCSSASIFMANVKSLGDVIHAGITHRHPNLKFVSVESGIGWIPYALDCMDWQWKNSGVREEHPEYDLLPSEYFKRQFFGCFWFEGPTAIAAIEAIGSENFLFETDFPHPTSLSPGPNTTAMAPKEHIRQQLAALDETAIWNVLNRNAARLYGREPAEAEV